MVTGRADRVHRGQGRAGSPRDFGFWEMPLPFKRYGAMVDYSTSAPDPNGTPRSMQFHVNPGDEVPIYRQIMHQISDAIAGGCLGPDDKLPSQRELALELVISHLTVKKAYEELERSGLIQTQRGRGTFVCAPAPDSSPLEARERLREAARRLLTRAHLAGLPFSDLLHLLEELHDERQS